MFSSFWRAASSSAHRHRTYHFHSLAGMMMRRKIKVRKGRQGEGFLLWRFVSGKSPETWYRDSKLTLQTLAPLFSPMEVLIALLSRCSLFALPLLFTRLPTWPVSSPWPKYLTDLNQINKLNICHNFPNIAKVSNKKIDSLKSYSPLQS